MCASVVFHAAKAASNIERIGKSSNYQKMPLSKDELLLDIIWRARPGSFPCQGHDRYVIRHSIGREAEDLHKQATTMGDKPSCTCDAATAEPNIIHQSKLHRVTLAINCRGNKTVHTCASLQAMLCAQNAGAVLQENNSFSLCMPSWCQKGWTDAETHQT